MNGSADRIDVRPTLLALLDSSRPLQGIPLQTLSDLSEAGMEQFQGTWRQLPLERRWAVVNALVELAEDQIDASFGSIYRWLLGDVDYRVRVRAIEGLWEDEDVRLIPPLQNLLESDPEEEVRAMAATSLGRFVLLGELDKIDATAATRTEAALLDTYRETETSNAVRRRILEALAYSSHDDVPQLIVEAYEDDDEEMRISAVFAMGRSADPRWQNYVLAELSSSESAMRYEAARASGELELSDAVLELIDMIDEDDVELRDAAVWSLGRIGSPEARRALRKCCASDDEELREAAEDALAELDFFSGTDNMPAFYYDS